MANHSSSFYFSISGEYDIDKLMLIIDNAFVDCEYSPQKCDISDYSHFQMEDTPAEYGEYRSIAEKLKDSIKIEFPQSEYTIHCRWDSLSASGFTYYEVEYKKGKATICDVEVKDDCESLCCPDCGEELEPGISSGDIYEIRTFRNKTINGSSSWKCAECQREFSFDDILQLMDNTGWTYSYYEE